MTAPPAIVTEADESGSSSLEVVAVLPLLMLLLMILVQMALWAHAAQVVHLAAAQGTRAAGSQGVSVGTRAARSVLEGAGSDVSSGRVSMDIEGDDLVVTLVQGQAVSIVPGLRLDVSSRQVGPVQEYRAPT